MSKHITHRYNSFRPRRRLITALAAGVLAGVLAGAVAAPAVGAADTPPLPMSSQSPSSVDTPTTSVPTTTTTSPSTAPSPTVPSAPNPSSPSSSTPVQAPTSVTPSSPTTPPESGSAHLYVASFIPYDGGITPVDNVRVRLTNTQTGAVTLATAPADLTLNVGTYRYETLAWPDGLKLISGSGNVNVGLLGNHIQISFARVDDGGGRTGTLQLVKADRVTGAKLPGARFVVSTCAGQVLGSATTGEGGVANREVSPGCYRVRETDAPKGYVVEGRSYTVDVSTDKVSTVTIFNTRVDHVSDRDPAGRTPLSSIPSGPVDRP